MSAAGSPAAGAPGAAGAVRAAPVAAEQVAKSLQALLGAAQVQAGPGALAPFRLQGVLPQAVAAPQTPEQVAAVLELAARNGWGVVPWGGGAWMDAGRPPRRYQVALSLSRLNRLIDHDADNLTCSAQAGLSLQEVSGRLRRHQQGLGLGVPGETHTLGGIVAANRVPPLRLLYGEVRDQVLALQVALPDGRLVRYGRKVLKNVAGYDMNKLFIGSEGLLGVITEVTAKLFALPDEQGHLLGQFSRTEDALACAAHLFRSRLLPARLVLLDGLAAQAFQARCGLPQFRAALNLLVSFEGRSAALRRQLEDARQAMMQHMAPDTAVLDAIPAEAERVLERPALALAGAGGSGLGRAAQYLSDHGSVAPEPNAAPVRMRLGAEMTALGGLLSGLRALAGSLPWAAAVDYGSGRLACAMGAPDLVQTPPLAEELSALRGRLEAQRGTLVLQGGPPPLLERLSPWGELAGELDLMRVLKSRFDPAGILAPGRFL